MRKIILEKFNEEDFSVYFQMVSDIKVMAQVTERAIPREEATENFQKLLIKNQRHEAFGSFKVIDSKLEQCVGLAHITLDLSASNKAEIGYMFLPEYWGQGYGKATVRQLLEIAETYSITELIAIIDPENGASRWLLTSNGFQSIFLGTMDGLNAEILSKKG